MARVKRGNVLKNRNRNEFVHQTIHHQKEQSAFLQTSLVSLDNIMRFIDSLRSARIDHRFIWESFSDEIRTALVEHYDQAKKLMNEIITGNNAEMDPREDPESRSKSQEQAAFSVTETILKPSKSMLLYKLADALMMQGKHAEAESVLRQAVSEWEQESLSDYIIHK